MSESEQKIAYAAVGVMIMDKGKVLLGLRAKSNPHVGGTWCFPGGKIEKGEGIKRCAIRETKEETSLTPRNLKVMSIGASINVDPHYIVVGFICNKFSGKLKNTEPHKFDRWEWFSIKKLPKPLFPATALMIKNYLNKTLISDK